MWFFSSYRVFCVDKNRMLWECYWEIVLVTKEKIVGFSKVFGKAKRGEVFCVVVLIFLFFLRLRLRFFCDCV